MAQGADISLNDGLATPVARTFSIVRAQPELSVWKDKRLAKPAYWPELSLSADVPATTARTRKSEMRLRKPIVDAVTGLVVDTAMIKITSDLPVSMTQAEVDDAIAFAANAFNNVLIKGAIKDLNVIIG